jgi:hypothetical protein
MCVRQRTRGSVATHAAHSTHKRDHSPGPTPSTAVWQASLTCDASTPDPSMVANDEANAVVSNVSMVASTVMDTDTACPRSVQRDRIAQTGRSRQLTAALHSAGSDSGQLCPLAQRGVGQSRKRTAQVSSSQLKSLSGGGVERYAARGDDWSHERGHTCTTAAPGGKRTPQSAQSSPHGQRLSCQLGPPSSQPPSSAKEHELEHTRSPQCAVCPAVVASPAAHTRLDHRTWISRYHISTTIARPGFERL